MTDYDIQIWGLADSGEREFLGSGTLIAPTLVLTAHHVLAKGVSFHVCRHKGTARTPVIEVFSPDFDQEVGSVVEPALRHDFDKAEIVDVAVLKLEEGLDYSGVKYDGDPLRPHLDWDALGYPLVVEGKTKEALDPVRCKTNRYEPSSDRIVLNVDVAPPLYDGLSGAAVLVNDRVVGVIRSVQPEWDNRSLEATPTARFLNEPWFSEARGLGKADKKIRDYLENLIAGTSKELRKQPSAWEALSLAHPPGVAPNEVARSEARSEFAIRELLNLPGAQFVAVIKKAMDRLAESASSNDRAFLWSLVERLISYLVNWRDDLVGSAQQMEADEAFFSLPFCIEPLAEIILAGAEQRPCEFVPFGYGITGRNLITMAASVHSPIPFSAPNLQAALVQKLAIKYRKLAQKDASPNKLGLDHLVDRQPYELENRGSEKALSEAVEGALFGEQLMGERLPCLVVIDEMTGDLDPDLAWTAVQQACTGPLTGLRAIRLTGSEGRRRQDEAVNQVLQRAYPQWK